MKNFARFFAAAFVLIAAALPAKAEVKYEERMIGDPNAPVTMIEYASFTCSHCAQFHNEILPQIKKDFVETGKVKIIFRDFPFERIGLSAALLSRCVDASRYEGFTHLVMKQQDKWIGSANPVASLAKLAQLAGMSKAQVDSCLQNENLVDDIVQVLKQAKDEHGFNSTPSFLINGERVIGSGDYTKFKNILESKLD